MIRPSIAGLGKEDLTAQALTQKSFDVSICNPDHIKARHRYVTALKVVAGLRSSFLHFSDVSCPYSWLDYRGYSINVSSLINYAGGRM